MNKNLPWFRLYSEFAKDPKIQSMSECMQRRLIMLFCLQCSDELQSLDDDELCCVLRIDIETLHETLQLFQKKKFIDENNNIINWDKRQYKSDNSSERVKKHREKQRVKDLKRYSNVTVTPPDTDTDTDTDNITPNPLKGEFEIIWHEYKKFDMPSKGSKKKAYECYCKARKETEYETIRDGVARYIDAMHQSRTKTKHVSTWLNQSGWLDEYDYTKADNNAKPSYTDTLGNASRNAQIRRMGENRAGDDEGSYIPFDV